MKAHSMMAGAITIALAGGFGLAQAEEAKPAGKSAPAKKKSDIEEIKGRI
jgi:hypothetical protein